MNRYGSGPRARMLAVLAAVALAGAACGSPGSGSSGSGSSSSSGVSAIAAKDAKALGINLSKCPTNPAAKLTGTIKVGETYAMSGGPAAAFAPVGQGVKVAFENFNATSGLPVKFQLIQADDQFSPPKALTATQQLIQQDQVSAMTTTIGTPQVLAIAPLLNATCVPLIAGAAGGAVADQPAKYPWTVTYTLPSSVDTRIWAASIAAKYPAGAKVAMFYSDDASGQEFYAAFKHYLANTKSKIVSTQTIEDTDSSAPASQVATMKASGANVLVAAPTGAACATLMTQVAAAGWKPAFYMSSTCPTALFGLVGNAANGVYFNQYIKDPSRPPYNNDPAVKAAVAALKKYSPKTPINNDSIAGMALVEPFFEAVKKAEDSPLGLSRLGLLWAATHMSFQPSLLIPGVRYQLNYPKDEVAMEAAELTRYNAKTKTFSYIKLYNFQGEMTGIASS